jgi:hypothetical protein
MFCELQARKAIKTGHRKSFSFILECNLVPAMKWFLRLYSNRTSLGVKQEPTLAPQKLAGVDCVPMEYRVRTAKDVVVVLPLDGGGLITYRRADGTYFHTLNIEFGFDRKLAQLGIALP